MIGIYKITNPKGRVYIGQSINLINRIKYYKNLNTSKSQIKLHRSFKKYGYDNHIFEVIEKCSISELNNKERYWQDFYNVIKKGLNCSLTTSNNKSGKLSEETKQKISKIHTGKIKLNFRGEKHPLYKREVSEKTREKIRVKNSKKVIDTETNIIYNSAKELSKIKNIPYSTLLGYLRGSRKNKTTFKYAE